MIDINKDLKLINEFYGITKNGDLYSLKPSIRRLKGVTIDGVRRYALTKPSKMMLYSHIEVKRLWGIDILTPNLPENNKKVNECHWLDLDTGKLWVLAPNSKHILNEVNLNKKQNGEIVYKWRMKTYVLDVSEVISKSTSKRKDKKAYPEINKKGYFKCNLGFVGSYEYWKAKALRDYREIGIEPPNNWLERSFRIWKLEEIDSTELECY